jgi:sigma-B regulation protein RsbU (phosphoserine phosphatase)
MVPASEVGGDYYDVLPAQDGCWIAIGDVAGHGLNAGLIMLMIQSSISAITRSLPAASPREVLLVLNEVLVENVRARLERREHATFTIFRYRHDGTLSYAGAHEDILVYRKATGTVEQISTSGAWVGARLRIEHVIVDDTLQLEDGDVVLLYSDGVTEAMSASLELFDIDRLRAALAAHASEPAQRICEAIHDEVRRFMQHQADDITLVAIRYRRTRH